jgi:ubiquitin carboxyl-terminal hydrolase 16/45
MPDGSPAQAAGTKYRLFGVVEHMGNLKSGHYVAYVRTGDDSWAYTSDSQTQAVAQEKVLGAQASLLCYEQIQ